MSIAVSAIVVPSRRLRALSAAFALANLAAAILVAVVLRERFQGGLLSAIFFLVAAVCLLHAALRQIKTLRIDVSGPGQVRLTVQQDVGADGARSGLAASPAPVTLLAGSTVWPQLLLLLLRGERGGLTVLPVLRDSVTPQQFRALSVAVLAVGARSAMADTGGPDAALRRAGKRYSPIAGKHKIL